MKKHLFFFLACFLFYGLQAQTKIRYSYDASGNRIKREIVLSQTRAVTNPQKETMPLSDMLAERTIRFYPNPTKGKLTVTISGNAENLSGEAQIFAMNGKCIASQKIKEASFSFDLSNQPVGNYLLKIVLDGQTTTWKVIKE